MPPLDGHRQRIPKAEQLLFIIAHLCAAAYTCDMFLREEIAKVKAEIERLEAAREGCSDTRILEVIEFRIEEQKLRLYEIRSAAPERQQPRY